MEYVTMLLPLIVVFGVMWLLIIRPQKKKDTKIADMRNNLSVGDEIVTIGGIVGKVTKVKDDVLVVQVGAEKNKLEFKRWAISEVTSKSDVPVKALPKKEEPEEVEEASVSPKKIKRLVKKEESDINGQVSDVAEKATAEIEG